MRQAEPSGPDREENPEPGGSIKKEKKELAIQGAIREPHAKAIPAGFGG
jgi:hypothetical protein